MEGITMLQKRILIVDDDREWSDLISVYLKEADYYVEVANSKPVAVDWLQRRPFDLVLTNLHLLSPRSNLSAYPQADYLGASVLKAVHRYAPGTPCIVISAHPNLVKKHLGPYPEWVDIINKSGLRLHELAETVESVIAEFSSSQSMLGASESRAGQIFRQLTEDPIAGMEALTTILLEMPQLRRRIPDLAVRLAKLKEFEKSLQTIGMLTGTEEAERRQAIHFAIGLCLELEEVDSVQVGELL
jgi:CheY-like chemotaxis protein